MAEVVPTNVNTGANAAASGAEGGGTTPATPPAAGTPANGTGTPGTGTPGTGAAPGAEAPAPNAAPGAEAPASSSSTGQTGQAGQTGQTGATGFNYLDSIRENSNPTTSTTSNQPTTPPGAETKANNPPTSDRADKFGIENLLADPDGKAVKQDSRVQQPTQEQLKQAEQARQAQEAKDDAKAQKKEDAAKAKQQQFEKVLDGKNRKATPGSLANRNSSATAKDPRGLKAALVAAEQAKNKTTENSRRANTKAETEADKFRDASKKLDAFTTTKRGNKGKAKPLAAGKKGPPAPGKKGEKAGQFIRSGGLVTSKGDPKASPKAAPRGNEKAQPKAADSKPAPKGDNTKAADNKKKAADAERPVAPKDVDKQAAQKAVEGQVSAKLREERLAADKDKENVSNRVKDAKGKLGTAVETAEKALTEGAIHQSTEEVKGAKAQYRRLHDVAFRDLCTGGSKAHGLTFCSSSSVDRTANEILARDPNDPKSKEALAKVIKPQKEQFVSDLPIFGEGEYKEAKVLRNWAGWGHGSEARNSVGRQQRTIGLIEVRF